MTPVTPMSAIVKISIDSRKLRKSIHSSKKGMVVTHIITMMIGSGFCNPHNLFSQIQESHDRKEQ